MTPAALSHVVAGSQQRFSCRIVPPSLSPADQRGHAVSFRKIPENMANVQRVLPFLAMWADTFGYVAESAEPVSR
jgi:hypothetical protein